MSFKPQQREERKRQAIRGNGSPKKVSRTPPGRSSVQRKSFASPEDVHPSPKSDAGVRYSSYPPNSFRSEKAREPRSAQPRKSNSSSSTMRQQHSSTMNGMYETPKELSRKPRRSQANGGSRDREAALRQKARMRRRMQASRPPGPPSSSANGGGSPEEGRPPRSTENGLSPRSSIRKQRREEQRRVQNL